MQFSSIDRPFSDEFVTLEDCYVHKITTKAVIITYEGVVYPVPKSQIREPDKLKRWQENVDIEVREWFARKNALI